MKDHIRDYSTEAFRFYAMNGKSSMAFKEKIYNEALESIKKREEAVKTGISRPTEQALIKAEQAVAERVSEIMDMEAVEMVLTEFRVKHKIEVIKSVELVYFTDADKELQMGDIKNRVIRASMEIPASERSVYMWLKKARDLFAYQRGLRIKKIS